MVSIRSEGETKMAICSCRLDTHSLFDLCARCVGEYLNLCAQAEIEDRMARTESDSEARAISDKESPELNQAWTKQDAETATLRDLRNAEQELFIVMNRARDALEAQEKRIVEQGRQIAALETVVGGLLRQKRRSAA